MMTKQDFEAIAHTLDANLAPLSLVQDFADMCKESNERFDRKRFILAATGNIRRVAAAEVRILAREVADD